MRVEALGERQCVKAGEVSALSRRPKDDSNRALDRVVHRAVVRRGQVVLDVPPRRRPEEVVHLEPCSKPISPELPRTCHLEIHRTDRGEAAGAIARPDEVLELVDRGPGEPRAELDDRRQIPLTRQSNRAAHDHPVPHVRRAEVVLVGADDRAAEIPKELIVAVEIRSRWRA